MIVNGGKELVRSLIIFW